MNYTPIQLTAALLMIITLMPNVYADTPLLNTPSLDPEARQAFFTAEKKAIAATRKIEIPKGRVVDANNLSAVKELIENSDEQLQIIQQAIDSSEIALSQLMPLLEVKKHSDNGLPIQQTQQIKANVNLALSALSKLNASNPDLIDSDELRIWGNYQQSRDALLAYTGSYEAMVSADPDSFDSLMGRYKVLSSSIQTLGNYRNLLTARLAMIRNAIKQAAYQQMTPAFDAESAKKLREADEKMVKKLSRNNQRSQPQSPPNFKLIK